MDSNPPQTTLISMDRAVPLPSDRRDGERYLTLLRVGSMTVDGQRHLCLIRNVSCGGMLIRTYSDMRPGTRLSIEFKHGESVAGTVRWVSDGNIGLMFDHAIDVLQLLETAVNGPRPRMPRVEVGAVAWVREGAATYRAETIDISQGGVKLRLSKPLGLRSQVVVTLTGLPSLAGVVCWNHGDCYGIRFDQVVQLQSLIRWLKTRQERNELRATG